MPWDSTTLGIERRCALLVSSRSQDRRCMQPLFAGARIPNYVSVALRFFVPGSGSASLLHCRCQLDNLLGSVVSACPALCLLTSPAELPRPETPVSQPCAKPPNESGGNLAIHCCKRAQTRQRTDSSLQSPVYMHTSILLSYAGLAACTNHTHTASTTAMLGFLIVSTT